MSPQESAPRIDAPPVVDALILMGVLFVVSAVIAGLLFLPRGRSLWDLIAKKTDWLGDGLQEFILTIVLPAAIGIPGLMLVVVIMRWLVA